MNDFHLLRPEWLLALPPLLLLIWLRARSRVRDANLQNICDPALLPHLLIPGRTDSGNRGTLLLTLAALLAVTALAGPTWSKRELPLFRQADALVILLDLSASMQSTDLAPSRLARARFKLLDILDQRTEGVTALVVYAAQAFVVTPLSDDSATIRNLVSALQSGIMPSQGSRPDLALRKGVELLRQAGAVRGQLLLISDGLSQQVLEQSIDSLDPDYPVSVLGVGTPDGAPVPNGSSGYLLDRHGNIVIARLDESRLAELATRASGTYQRISADDSDVRRLLAGMHSGKLAEKTSETGLTSDQWHEQGPWLLLLLLPLAALAFRRGYLALAIILLGPLPHPVEAGIWEELWLRPDQQAERLMQSGKHAEAARRFEDPAWRAAAHYRAGNFEQSLESLPNPAGADDHYNRGNALARLGELPEALQAYEQALELRPEDADARHNYDLIKELLQQQQQQQQQKKNHDQAQPSQADDGKERGGARESDVEESDAPKPAPASGDRSRPERDAATASQGERSDEQSQTDRPRQPEARAQEAQARGRETETDAVDSETLAQQRQEQATQQWLERIPDDPSGLLRRKFLYQYREQYQGVTEPQPW